jgi:hypothetical protein
MASRGYTNHEDNTVGTIRLLGEMTIFRQLRSSAAEPAILGLALWLPT